MPRQTNSHSQAKARSRSNSRAPGGSRSHRKPYLQAEGSPAAKYAARAAYKAKKRNEMQTDRGEPKIDLRTLARSQLEKNGFEPGFSLVIEAKANALDESTVERALPSVKDLRHLLWSSIGNSDDIGADQVEYCERGQGGSIAVKVAIADVDAFVPKGSLLDMKAEENALSVYTKAGTFPMLPERLSGDLSSLPMERDRLAVVAEFSVLPRGNLRLGKIFRAVVRNRAQLSYGEAGEILAGTAEQEMIDEIPGLEEQLKLQDEATAKMDKFRMQGAPGKIEGDGISKGDVSLGLCIARNDAAERIIENFTIGANDAMHAFLDAANSPSIRRVIKTPKSWEGIVAVAKANGFALPPAPDAAKLSEFLGKEKAAHPEKFSDLSLAIAKLLGSGGYEVFSKAIRPECFCFATESFARRVSPNGRYVDLVNQRLVKAALAHAPAHYSMDELVGLAKWCTDRGHAAIQVERAVRYAVA